MAALTPAPLVNYSDKVFNEVSRASPTMHFKLNKPLTHNLQDLPPHMVQNPTDDLTTSEDADTLGPNKQLRQRWLCA